MPIYDFKCEKCGEVSEKLVKMDTIKIDCPKDTCNGISKRFIQQGSTSNFILKGNGWYKTDFKSK